ncbi:hypothetical protein [Ruthenibacterium lactatiformans]|uniref:hypothetical protein n=1 Tax=Ruthenibacterium lactatiformans TaxID=1550024 RepID=UPI003AB11AFF
MTQSSSEKRKKAARQRKKAKKPEKLEFVQDFIPVKSLQHGIIETTDGRYIRILEIEPINFMLRSGEEQFNIISSFASWLKISPMRLQFKSITRKADSDKHVAMIHEELEVEESEECRHLGEGYIRLIKDVGSREALTRRFFLIFQYEEIRRGDGDDFSQIYGMMQTAEQNARAYFLQCGNTILQPKDPDEATAEILYMFFNRRSCVDEPFSSRVNRVVVDTMVAKDKVIGVDPIPPIRMAHFLSPRGIDLTHHNYVVMDGLYYSFLFIKGNGYPGMVRAGWMSALINAGDGIDIDVQLRRENRSKTIEEPKPVSQSEPKEEVSLSDPVHETDQNSESGKEAQNRAEENAPEPKQPAAGNGQPTPEPKQPEPPKPTEPPAEPKQEETPVSAVEPESPKTIYDYAFDVEAIRSELIALGQSMGLTHITDDDGIPCTPDTCSWASPVTASESFQGNNLKRALQNYVTSMPSTIASYGGTQITCFTIYVRDNGGGSYTFYFLY